MENDSDMITIDAKKDSLNLNYSKKIIQITNQVSNLIINGNKNKIFISSTIFNCIMNGQGNVVNCENRSSLLSNLIINGSSNEFRMNQGNYQGCNQIDNGSRNKFKVGSSTANSQEQGSNYSNYGNPNRQFNFFTQNSSFVPNQDQNNFTFSYSSNVNNNSNVFGMLDQIFNSSFGLNMQQATEFNNFNQFQNSNFQQYFSNQQNTNNQNNNQNSQNQEEMDQVYLENLRRLKKELIKKLPTFEYSDFKKKYKTKQDNCPICLENFKIKETIKLSSCRKHIFHQSCILEWLKSSNYCPLCKHDLLEDYYE